MFDTVIFDCDGTLSDSEYLNNKATADVLAELGFPRYTVEVSMDKFVGMAMTEVKKFIETERLYKHGQQGLAYEIVINSNPGIAYLMEENAITMQALGMAHAC